MPRIRSITAAVNTPVRVSALNANRKPRHVDNGLLALSWIYRRLGNQGKARWVTVEYLRKILEEVYYNNLKRFLGPYFPCSFRRVIPDLVEQGYLRWNTDKTKFRVSKQMAILCMQAASQTPGEEVDRHCAHADYFRQKISFTRPTYAMVVEENKELREENSELKGRLRVANAPDFLREASIATFASDEIYDMDDELAGQGEEAEMVDDTAPGLSHHTSGLAFISTPIKPTCTSGPEDFYPTPQSLPHACAGARPPPLSPSLGRASFSSRGNPVDGMDVDEGPVVGPSGSTSSIPSYESIATMSVPNHDTDIVYLARVVNASKSTLQSIEETYRTQISEFEREAREARELQERILKLTSTLDKEQEEWKEERSMLVEQLEQHKERIGTLEDELAVSEVLLGRSREKERLGAIISEEKDRVIEALRAVGTVKYQDEDSHEKLRANMLEEKRRARSELCDT